LPVLLGAILGVFGCGSGEGPAPTNAVTGKCTFNGNPVNGTVVFVGSDGKEVSTPVSPVNGSYTIVNPPTGDVKVAVRGMAASLPPPPVKDMPAQQSLGVAPPAKYADPNNGLTFKVDKGRQTFDIPLKE